MKKNIVFFIICLALLLKFQLAAHAANFSVSCPKYGDLDFGCIIEMHGQIIEGDTKKLLKILSQKPKTSDIYRWLALDSKGGDVREALNIAKIVRDAMLSTQNFPGVLTQRSLGDKAFICASSCVIIAMAGVSKSFLFHNGGGLGLHRPYIINSNIDSISPSNLADSQNQAMRVVRDYFTSERMPQRLIEEMMNRSSKDVYWVTIDDYYEIPVMPAWYEEILIAQCQYDSSIERRLSNPSIKRNQAAYNSAMAEIRRQGACSRTLIEQAQKRLQIN